MPPTAFPVTASPTLLDTRALEAALDHFATERDWAPFHTPRNLVMALTGEVGELNEIFQWLTEPEAAQAAANPATARPVRDEIADVLLYLVRLASVLGVDLDEAVRHKLAANAVKYPVETARGSRVKAGGDATLSRLSRFAPDLMSDGRGDEEEAERDRL